MNQVIDDSVLTQEDFCFQKSLSRRFNTAFEHLFECGLGAEPKKADVSLLFLNVGNQGIHGNLDEDNLRLFPQKIEAWRKINSFFRHWQASSSELWSFWINYTWMECDNNGEDPQSAVPNIFFNTVGGEVETIQRIPKEKRRDHTLQVTEEVFRFLVPESLPHPVNQKMLQIFRQLPEWAYIGDVGVMFQRGPYQIKFVIRELPFHGLCDYLSRIGWKGNTGHITAFFTSALKHINEFRLSIDIGMDALSPKLGVEYFVKGGADFLGKWDLFFSLLVDYRLCTVRKKNAILDYVRQNKHRETLAHAKVAFLPDKLLEAKAYLYNVGI